MLYKEHPNKRFEVLDQAELRTGWEKEHGTSNMDWDQARDATHDAYTHVYESHTVKHEDYSNSNYKFPITMDSRE